MTDTLLSRKEFLQIGSLGLGALALPNYASLQNNMRGAIGLVRVGRRQLRVFKEPDYESDVLTFHNRDEFLRIRPYSNYLNGGGIGVRSF